VRSCTEASAVCTPGRSSSPPTSARLTLASEIHDPATRRRARHDCRWRPHPSWVGYAGVCVCRLINSAARDPGERIRRSSRILAKAFNRLTGLRQIQGDGCASIPSPPKYGILSQMFGPASLSARERHDGGSTIVAILL